MKVTVAQLKELKSPFATFVAGDATAEAYRPWPPEIAPPGALVYVSTPQQLEAAIEAPAGIIIATAAIAKMKVTLAPNQALFATPAINAAMALVNPRFDKKSTRWPTGLSPQAIVHPSAKIGQNVSIGAFSIIGSDVHIGDDTIIAPHCVIEDEVHIGNKVYLHPFVHIGSDSEIGNHVEINSHTTIGSDGFGFVTDPQQKIHHKVPQIGKVVIEDHVEIGSSCSIDRATLHETRIGKGTKMDNQVHIAHNCKVGNNCLLAACFAMAGSATIGSNVTCGGSVLISDHVNVTDDVVIGGNSAVTKDITTSGMYLGYPLQPWREGLKTLASLASVPELRKEVAELNKRVGIDKT